MMLSGIVFVGQQYVKQLIDDGFLSWDFYEYELSIFSIQMPQKNNKMV
jgi:hypothetical protein